MKLTTLLLKETEQLKFDYIDRCLEYASKEWDRIREDVKNRNDISSNWTSEWNRNRCASKVDQDAFEKKYNNLVIKLGYVKYDKWGYRKDNGRISQNAYDKFQSDTYKIRNHQVMCFDRKDYIERAFKQAEKHYFNSIDRLANRIQRKELNESNLTLKTSYIDQNISTTISDGDKTVRAYTIIACGDVQRPHYRYLVK